MPTLTAPYVHPFGDAVAVDQARVIVRRADALASDRMDRLARDAVFGDGAIREAARWLIWELGQQVGVRPSSIHGLYMARGRGLVHGFTVPAINVRGMAYDTARSVFRTAKRLDAGAFICEIARSEIGYTDQRPAEYAAVIVAAALREGFRGPVFIQGDHYQVNAKKYAADPRPEVDAVIQLARESVAAGFYNIDVDTSTLVDLHRQTLADQQRLNVEVGGEIAAHVRSIQPKGVTISIGGEIGEVGTQNSTVEELRAYMDGLNAVLASRLPADTPGLVENQRAIRHIARRRGATRWIDRGCEAGFSHARRPVTRGASRLRVGGRGPARCLDTPRRGLQSLSAYGDGGDPPRDELPEHAVRWNSRGVARRDL